MSSGRSAGARVSGLGRGIRGAAVRGRVRLGRCLLAVDRGYARPIRKHGYSALAVRCTRRKGDVATGFTVACVREYTRLR
jgi:hypothetical protein